MVPSALSTTFATIHRSELSVSLVETKLANISTTGASSDTQLANLLPNNNTSGTKNGKLELLNGPFCPIKFLLYSVYRELYRDKNH